MTTRWVGSIWGGDYMQVEGDRSGIVVETVNSSICLYVAQLDDLITLLLDLRSDLQRDGLVKGLYHAKEQAAYQSGYSLGHNDAAHEE